MTWSYTHIVSKTIQEFKVKHSFHWGSVLSCPDSVTPNALSWTAHFTAHPSLQPPRQISTGPTLSLRPNYRGSFPRKPQTPSAVLPCPQGRGCPLRQPGYPPEMQGSSHLLEALPSFPTPLQFSQDSATRSFLTVQPEIFNQQNIWESSCMVSNYFSQRSQIKEI